MANASQNKVSVNLSASQTRKLLKGRGFGVLRVEAAGKGRAVVVHTATGQHRRELEQLLASAEVNPSSSKPSNSIGKIRNIGPVSAEWLANVGVKTRRRLEEIGPVVAYRLVKQKYPRASLNLLWALAAGIMDRDWQDLSARERSMLKAELESD